MIYQNPIIKGFHPDPSICFDGEYFYLVTSTFEFFPGIPIFRSRNLVNWELTGHCLTRDSQLPLDDAACSGGIYAPTIRFHQGKYYMVTTNVSHGGHLIVQTNDPSKEWSEPVHVEQDGIDPSLLFDEDRVYFVSTTVHNGHQAIAMCEINPDTGEKYSDSKIISYGTGGKYPEAPHVYRIGGMYYLMLAEGGTEYGHMVTIQRSATPYGPYEPCPHNPILSHRDYMNGDIQCTGHGDWTQDGGGNWWMVCLGVRPLGTMLHNLGRETFLAPVVWENGWPVVGDHGHIALTMEAELPGVPMPVPRAFADDFQEEQLRKEWSFVRNPIRDRYQVGRGVLRLSGVQSGPDTLQPTLLAVPQTEFNFHAYVNIQPESEASQAGLIAFYNKDYYYALRILRQNGAAYSEIEKHLHDSRFVDSRVKLPEGKSFTLHLYADRSFYRFYAETACGLIAVGQGSTAGLSTEGTMNMSFTGTMIGIFAAEGSALFRGFHYEENAQCKN